jgi:hypothetical protein
LMTGWITSTRKIHSTILNTNLKVKENSHL